MAHVSSIKSPSASSIRSAIGCPVFETRNPGIPGIINKLDRPGVRKLETARVFWDTILSVQPLSVFSRASQYNRITT
jgi:hypothetical protein